MKKINKTRLLLYKSIIEKGLSHPNTIKLSMQLDKLLLTDLKHITQKLPKKCEK